MEGCEVAAGDGDEQLPPEARRALALIRADREHGASYLAGVGADLLAQMADDIPADEAEARLALVRAVARAVAGARLSMAALANVAARIWSAGSGGGGRRDAPTRLRLVRDEAVRVRRGLDEAPARIAELARPLLGEVVYTLSRSGTVERALGLLASADGGQARPRRVIVAESRPGGEGVATARALAAVGLDVMLVPDAACGAFVGEASAVALGADSVRADGGVVNKVGSYPLALAAREAEVPVYALCETLKIAAPDFPLVLETLEWSEMPADVVPGVHTRSVAFELTPAGLLAGVVTEEGVLGRARIAERAQVAGAALATLTREVR